MRAMCGKIALLVAAVAAVAALSGCVTFTSSKSFTFDVETGDSVVVELDTSTGYDLRPDGSDFYVSKDGADIVGGMFLTQDSYQQLVRNAHEDPDAQFITDTEGVCEYTYSPENGGQTYVLMWLPTGNTGIGLYSLNDANIVQVEEAMSLLTISIDL